MRPVNAALPTQPLETLQTDLRTCSAALALLEMRAVASVAQVARSGLGLWKEPPPASARHVVIPVFPLDGADARFATVPLRYIGTAQHRDERLTPAGPFAFATDASSPTGELIIVGDIADALAASFLTGRAYATFGGPSIATRTAEVAHWLARRRPAQLRAILPSSQVGDVIRHILVEVSASTLTPLRVEMLPAGVKLRDIGRLHGPTAMRDWIVNGARSLALPSERRPAREPNPRRCVSPRALGVIGKVCDRYLAHLESNCVIREDVTRTHRDLERFIRVATTLELGALEHFTSDVLDHVRRLLESQEHCSRNHAIHVLGCFRRMLRWLQRQGTPLPDALVEFTLPRRRAMPPPAVLSARDVEGVLDAIGTTRPAGLRDRSMLELLYATAIRRVELVGLDLVDIDYRQRVIRVRCGKGGTARVVPVHRRALDWITRYIEQVRVQHVRHAAEPALFLSRSGRRMRPTMVTARMSACLRTVGLGGKGSVHIFRHTVATLMHDAGADIRDLQALLGHAVLTSTQLYTRVSLMRLQDVYGRTHPVARSNAAGLWSGDEDSSRLEEQPD